MFIGLTDLVDEGQFCWESDLTSLNYTNWLIGEPDNLGDEDCVEILGMAAFEWNDADCSKMESHAVCQKFP